MSEDQEGSITVRDVYNAFNEAMNGLDHLWPDSDRFGPRKVHMVELLDGIKLKLIQTAEANALKHVSAFQAAARKITGYDPKRKRNVEPVEEELTIGPTSAEKHQAAKDRIAKSSKFSAE